MLFYDLYSIMAQYPPAYTGDWGYFPIHYDVSVTGDVSHPFTINTCYPISINALTVYAPNQGPANDPHAGDANFYGGIFGIDIKPTMGNIIIQNGAYFDAKCPNNCCMEPDNTYLYEPDNTYSADQRQINNADSNNAPTIIDDSVPYKMNNEFASKPDYDAILAYPNPFVNETTFEFFVKETTPITIILYNASGEKVTDVILNKSYDQGSYATQFNGSDLAAGSYICVMTTKDDKKTFKLIKK